MKTVLISFVASLSVQLSFARKCYLNDKIFAPYTQTWIYGAQKNLLQTMNENNLDRVIAAFAIAQVNGPWSECNSTQTLDPSYKLTWGGDVDSTFGEQVKEAQAAGKEVIASFGGYADRNIFPKGREIGGLIENVDKLAEAYISFIEQHNLTWVDFDIEEGGLLNDTTVSRRRNDAIAQIVKKIPNLKIMYTLPVSSKGLKNGAIALLADATSKNLPLFTVNLMVMDFDEDGDYNLGETAVKAMKAVLQQFKTSNINYKIGATPMIGQNDIKKEIFTINDAKLLRDFVRITDVNFLGYWSLERDTPGSVTSGIGQEGCKVSFATSMNSGTNVPAGEYLNALRIPTSKRNE